MKNNIFLFLPALITVFLGGCIVINNDYDYHVAYFKNDSSHNIYIQSYTKLNDYYDSEEKGNFWADGISLQPHTVSETAAPFDYERPNLEKILFVDAGTHTRLKKITGAAYYNMLSEPEKTIENNTYGGKVTNYTYYFVITDEFLNNK
jgi:hypothetical protein